MYIDEIQKVPALLNFVHKHIEADQIKFALTGSSARKLTTAAYCLSLDPEPRREGEIRVLPWQHGVREIFA